MINYVNRALFLEDSIDKQLNIVSDDGTVSITNTELHQNAFELEEKICDKDTLVFGLAEPSVLRFTISNVFTSMKNKWLTVYTTLNHDLANPFIFGRYKVYSDKPTADRKKREIVAYDALYDILNADVTTWYKDFFKYTSKSTLKVFRNSFFSHFNISEVDIDLPNDSMKITKTIDPKELSGRTVVNAICEINGCFGHIERSGKFKYVFLEKMSEGLYPSHDLYPSEEIYPTKPNGATLGTGVYIPPCTYEDYVTDLYTGVKIRKEDNDIGATAGSASNAYVIQDNFLVYGKGSDELLTIARNILNVIKDIVMRPFSTKAKGNPCVEVGDLVRLNTKTQRIESYVLQRVLTGIQALMDSYEASVSKQVATKANSVTDQIIQLKGKSNTLERTIEQTRSELRDLESETSSLIEQTASSITLSVTNKGTTSGITISLKDKDGNTIDSDSEDIVITGAVTFNDLEETNGTTRINGGNIIAGTLKVDAAEITGTLKVSQIENAERGTITFFNMSCYELYPAFIYDCQGISTDSLYLYDTETEEKKNVSDWINSVQNGVDQINSNLSDWDLEARVSELERMVASVGLLNE